MAIILVPQPGSAPTDVTDWEDSVETLKQYNLGVNSPVDYNFDDDTIKKGVLITIGGSNYYCNADTVITGTASDYVKVTSDGVATYVSSLSGVSWNDTYNFYADSSGNAYIFNEAKAVYDGSVSGAKTAIGKLAQQGYFEALNLSGNLNFVGGNEFNILNANTNSGSTKVIDLDFPNVSSDSVAVRIGRGTSTTGSLQLQLFKGDGSSTITFKVVGSSGDTTIEGDTSIAGIALIGGATDNGIDALQVNGSVSCDSVTTEDDVDVGGSVVAVGEGFFQAGLLGSIIHSDSISANSVYDYVVGVGRVGGGFKIATGVIVTSTQRIIVAGFTIGASSINFYGMGFGSSTTGADDVVASVTFADGDSTTYKVSIVL